MIRTRFIVLAVVFSVGLDVGDAAQSAAPFSFAGITLDSSLDQLAKRYASSTRVGDHLYVAAQDSHDHISGIQISGTGDVRRVRISFELQRDGSSPEYPTCRQVQAKLEQQLGRPTTIRKFDEEASPRADRVWTSTTEELTLICFAGKSGTLFAEAVQINRRPSPQNSPNAQAVRAPLALPRRHSSAQRS